MNQLKTLSGLFFFLMSASSFSQVDLPTVIIDSGELRASACNYGGGVLAGSGNHNFTASNIISTDNGSRVRLGLETADPRGYGLYNHLVLVDNTCAGTTNGFDQDGNPVQVPLFPQNQMACGDILKDSEHLDINGDGVIDGTDVIGLTELMLHCERKEGNGAHAPSDPGQWSDSDWDDYNNDTSGYIDSLDWDSYISSMDILFHQGSTQTTEHRRLIADEALLPGTPIEHSPEIDYNIRFPMQITLPGGQTVTSWERLPVNLIDNGDGTATVSITLPDGSTCSTTYNTNGIDPIAFENCGPNSGTYHIFKSEYEIVTKTTILPDHITINGQVFYCSGPVPNPAVDVLLPLPAGASCNNKNAIKQALIEIYKDRADALNSRRDDDPNNNREPEYPPVMLPENNNSCYELTLSELEACMQDRSFELTRRNNGDVMGALALIQNILSGNTTPDGGGNNSISMQQICDIHRCQ